MLRYRFVRSFAVVASCWGAALVIGLCLILVAGPASILHAAPTSGVVGTGTPGSCTEAALDTALGSGGSITFNCGANPYTITVTSQKVITLDTTIDGGSRITLSGNGAAKIFVVESGARLMLSNLTVADGASSFGGCISVIGGTLNATQTTIRNCAAHAGFFSAEGGAISGLNATIALTNTSILSNSADDNGGGLFLYGGQATLNNVNVLNNTATFTYTDSGGGLYITATAQVTINNSQIANNYIGDHNGQGGGVYAANSTLSLSNLSVNNNGGYGANGNGLYVEGGSVRLTGGIIDHNPNAYYGGGIDLENTRADLTNITLDSNNAAEGGGLHAFQSTVNLTDVMVSNNSGSDGAGIAHDASAGTFTRITVVGNQSNGYGGGLYTDHRSYTHDTTLSIVDSTFRNNTAPYIGGGIYNREDILTLYGVTINNNAAGQSGGGFYNDNSSYADLTNVTLSANTAISGGGIYNGPYNGYQGFITLTNVTLKDNSAVDGGGIYNVNDPNAVIHLKNTIIADSPNGGNCKGKSLAAVQYNLSSDNTCVLSGIGDKNNVDPLLTYLADNGGWTKTHLPKIGSPAIDGIIGTDCPSFDQRGVGRPKGSSCDIGSVERAPSDPPYPVGAYLPLLLR